MLILAGISVSVLFGEGGIIDKARLAGEKTNAAVENEQRMLDDIADWMDAVNDKLPASLAEAAASKYQFKVTTKMTDNAGKTITIPKGFHVVGKEEDETVKYTEGDDTPKVSDGIVIQDADGNQFVWVPVENVESEYKKHDYTRTNKNDAGTNVKDEDEGGWNTWYYRNYNDWTDKGTNETSVKENKGFYIARYEAGVPKNASFYVDTDSAHKTYETSSQKNKTTDNAEANLKPVSKAKTQAWNYISQTNAKIVSKNMYEGANVGVTSSLVDGIAWDTIVNWIAKDGTHTEIAKNSTENGNYADNSNITASDTLWAEHLLRRNSNGNTWSGWMPALKYQTGEYTPGGGTTHELTEGDKDKYADVEKYLEPKERYKFYEYKELATGASEKTRLKNIYDLAGNMYEWTTETGFHGQESSSTEYAVRRGGGFYDSGSDAPVSLRSGDDSVDFTDVHLGFRVLLYVK